MRGVSSGRGENRNGDRDYFTPLWRIKGAKSFAKTVESEGFVPLRKVCVTGALSLILTCFEFP